MKPKPASSMQRATPSGSRSMRAPSASSRSAEPEELVAERLPCLATAQPAPAAISAAVVETLNVLRPPPVPAVSSRSSRSVGTCAASARIVRASPASSSTVSPFVLSAIRNPAICVSETSPCMISASTSAVSSALRSLREASASIARGEGRVGHQPRSRKLASSFLPSSVSTDSGWNWTPSAGSSRWRNPISTPPPRADSSRQSGRSGSTTSEW